MAYRVYISDYALRDLEAIHEYISSELKSPRTSKKLTNELINEIYSLDEFPNRYPYHRSRKFKDLRKMVVKNYLVFYRVNEKDKSVMVYRIVYSRKDIS